MHTLNTTESPYWWHCQAEIAGAPHLDDAGLILPGVGHVEDVEGGQLVPGNLNGNTQATQATCATHRQHATAGRAVSSDRWSGQHGVAVNLLEL